MARDTWRPKVDNEPNFNPFAAPDAGSVSPLNSPKLRDAEEDTAPLQGSKDRSDDDSLNDVIADEYEEDSEPTQRSP